MTHDIERDASGRASFFSAREVPWHHLGTVTKEAQTAHGAMIESNLDWGVDLFPLFTQIDGDFHEVDDRKAVVRSSDHKVLGTVGTHYVPFKNAEAFQFMDNLVDSGEAKYETAGALRGGKIVFLTLKVPCDILIGGEDLHELYLLLRTSHDGTKAISVYVTPIRVVCQNTLALATYGRVVKQKWSVTHVSTVHGRLAEARNSLNMTFKYVDEFKKIGDRLLSIKLNSGEFDQLLDRVLPNRPKTQSVKLQITGIYNTSPTIRYPGTAWGALNAISEYFDWYRRSGSEEARFINTIDGVGAKARNTATALLLTM